MSGRTLSTIGNWNVRTLKSKENKVIRVMSNFEYTNIRTWIICTSYHMARRALANLSHEGTKRPRAIN